MWWSSPEKLNLPLACVFAMSAKTKR